MDDLKRFVSEFPSQTLDEGSHQDSWTCSTKQYLDAISVTFFLDEEFDKFWGWGLSLCFLGVRDGKLRGILGRLVKL